MITGLVIYPLVCFPGVLGNTLTLFVLSRRNMQTSTNAFLSALAVSDSVKLINDILYFFVIVFMKTSTTLGNLSYGYLYPYAHFIFSLSACVSSWLTVSVAVERYLLVCHPTRARAVWSRKRAVFLCTMIYVIMTLLALPSALRYRTIGCVDINSNLTKLDVELTEMWQNPVFVKTYTWAQNLLRSIIPLLVLVVLNTCIITALRRSQAKKRKNARHRVTVMMIVVILAFLICITPDAIMSTVFGFGYHEETDYLPRGIREITDALLAVNAGVNFLIYCVFNQVFRKSFLHLCCHKTRRNNTWMTELEESTYRRCSDAKSLIMSNNNSPPRHDTTPTLLTDNSPVSCQSDVIGKNPSDDHRGTTPNYINGCPNIQNEMTLNDGTSDHCQQQPFRLHNHDTEYPHDTNNSQHKQIYDSNNHIQQLQPHTSKPPQTPHPSNHQHQPHTSNHQHQHRISKDGLKKSRNSIKCTRSRHRATGSPHCHSEEIWREKSDVCPDKSLLRKSTDNVRSEMTCGTSLIYQNQLLTKVCACVHNIPRDTSSHTLSEQRNLNKVNILDVETLETNSTCHDSVNVSTNQSDFLIDSCQCRTGFLNDSSQNKYCNIDSISYSPQLDKLQQGNQTDRLSRDMDRLHQSICRTQDISDTVDQRQTGYNINIRKEEIS
ncbi:hypothetical protein Btru_028877 [Bulinus truncatus]|nr:hypothetical protein Btru_028877 [Bulinus truncatus]